MKAPLKRYDSTYQVTSCALSNDALKLYTGGIDNDIKIWDGRKSSKPMMTLSFHSDTISSLNLSNDENYLLSNSMDGNICIWDIGSFVNRDQLVQLQQLQTQKNKKDDDEEQKQEQINKINSNN
eukprot:48028_1